MRRRQLQIRRMTAVQYGQTGRDTPRAVRHEADVDEKSVKSGSSMARGYSRNGMALYKN